MAETIEKSLLDIAVAPWPGERSLA